MKKKLFILAALLLSTLFATACGSPTPKSCKDGETLQNGACVKVLKKEVCGDGEVTGTETCDKKILFGEGACDQPADCVDDIINYPGKKPIFSGSIEACTAKCEYVDPECDNTKKDSFCPANCTKANDLDCLGTDILCGKDGDPNTPDNTKCASIPGATCQQVDSIYLCKAKTACPSSISGKGDPARCAEGEKCVKNSLNDWVCVPSDPCDNGKGQPDQTLCKTDFSYCDNVGGKYLCVVPTKCENSADEDIPDQTKCKKGLTCRRANAEFLCLPEFPTCQPGKGADCYEHQRCYTNGSESRCYYPGFCQKRDGTKDDSLCNTIPGSTCTDVGGGLYQICS